MRFKNSYAVRHPLTGVVINLLLLLAMALLVIGVKWPIITVEKFYFFDNTVSLLSAVRHLWEQSEWALALLIGGFSLLFPVFKLMFLFWVWNLEDSRGQSHQRHLHWLEMYSKWSMLDVFVVALLVVSVKLGAMAQARVEYGLYAFSVSVLLTMLVSAWIGNQTRVANK